MKQKFTVEPAPMAGFTDRAFRKVLIKCGAKATWTEMVSATALFYKSKKTNALLEHDGKTIVQLFGKTPAHFEWAIKSGLLDDFTEININMGCPATKIIKNGEGCALMKKPELARQIIEACVQSTHKPVSVKFRLGFDKNIAVEFAKICEQAGASRLIVHGRLGTQGYSGTADWTALHEIVHAVKVPVIANGDINSFESAEKCIEVTGASGVMIGRALIGAPWLINLPHTPPPMHEQKKIIKYHLEQADNILELRKHLLAYSHDKETKKRLAVCKSFEEAKEIFGI